MTLSLVGVYWLICLLSPKHFVSIQAIQRVYVVGSDVLCTEDSSRDKIQLL